MPKWLHFKFDESTFALKQIALDVEFLALGKFISPHVAGAFDEFDYAFTSHNGGRTIISMAIQVEKFAKALKWCRQRALNLHLDFEICFCKNFTFKVSFYIQQLK